MSTDPTRQQGQYPPPSWESQPQRGAYPPPPQEGLPAPHPYPQQNQSSAPGDMVTLPPPQSQQHPDLYRQPPYDIYQQHPHHIQYQQHPHEPHRDPHAPQINFNQPAPRQRTAIACRYCRRRKIRCHGFDSSPDGRCTNCIRFHQECIFTPVSSQAHAFVPAHTAYPHLRNTGQMQQHPNGRPMYTQDGQPMIYGAHGQPLGPIPPQSQDPNYGPQGYAQNPYPVAVYDDRGGVAPPHPHDQVSRKRPRLDDSLYPTPISQTEGMSSHPYPSQQRLPTASGRRGSGAGGQFEYPDPTGLAPVSPASSTQSYQSTQYPQAPQPYYPSSASVRRSPPQPSYSYEGRASTSPHSTSSAATYPYYGGLHPPQVLPPARETGRTPPPAASPESNGSRAGMSVRDMLGPGDGAGGRTSADSDMLKALNKRGM